MKETRVAKNSLKNTNGEKKALPSLLDIQIEGNDKKIFFHPLRTFSLRIEIFLFIHENVQQEKN